MDTRTLRFSKFIEEEFGASVARLKSEMQDAYQAASLLGKKQNDDGELKTILLAPLEGIRLSDAQGEFAQHHLHKWGTEHAELEAGFDANKRKRNHVVVRARKALLTSHRVPSPSSFPPNAVYRQSNAQQNLLWLPGLSQPEKLGDVAYIFLLHGPSLSDTSKLGFLRLAMPNPDGKGYLAYYDVYVHEDFNVSSKIEEIPDTALITLKTTRKKVHNAS
ncbi:MAG: hypothetical protein DELT_00822 [Desulfovibrio sp.]